VAAPPAPGARAKRLQVGYFSGEDNAQALKDELASKGFSAFVEPRMRAAGAGKAEEKRWVVVVDGGKDLAATQQSLKDAGYESYLTE
jgi:cell division protein FtsN